MFKDQAIAYSKANSVSPGWFKDYDEEEDAAAAQMAVKAAEVYQQTGSYADAIAVFPLVATQLSGKKQTEDGGDSAGSELEEIGRQLEALAAQRAQQLEKENPLSVN